MANALHIAPLLLGLVGWRVPAGGACPIDLPDSLTQSESGLFVQDVSELVGFDVVQALCPPGEALAEYLTRITQDALTRLGARVLATLDAGLSRPLLADTPLVPGLGRLSDTVSKEGRFVGFRLMLPRRAGLATTLARVGLQLDTRQASVPLYVYRDGEPEAVRELAVTVARAGTWAWLTLPEPLALEAETDYVVGYYESDLLGYAVRRDWKPAPCYCAGDPWPQYAPYAAPQPVALPAAALQPDRSRPLLEQAQALPATYGLNLELAVGCRVEALLSHAPNRLKLAEAAQLALAIRVLEGIVGTTAITQLTQRADIRQDAYALLTRFGAMLYGGKDSSTEQYYPGLLKSVKLDVSALDSACLPQAWNPLGMGQLIR